MSSIIVLGAGRLAKFLCTFKGVSGYVNPKEPDLIVDPSTDKVVGKVTSDTYAIMGIADSRYKKQAADLWTNKDRKLISIIHPNAIIIGDPKIGEGSVIFPQTVILGNSKIGKCCIVAYQSIIEESQIGDYCHITFGCKLIECKVSSGVMIGSGTIIMNNRRVGSNSVIGAGSIIYKDVPANKKIISRIPKIITESLPDNFRWSHKYFNSKK